MSLFSLLAALIAQHFRLPPEPNPWSGWLQRGAVYLERHFNAGERRYGILAWIAAALVVFVPLTLFYLFLRDTSTLLAWALNTAVLYFTIRYRGVLISLSVIQQALRRGEIDEARERLARWIGRPTAQYDAGQVARVAIERALLDAYRDLFAVLFWFLILPGPAGALLYQMALTFAEQWRGERDKPGFGWFAQRMFEIMDWAPQRLTAISFAIVGDFEDALYCWRSQAAAWMQATEGVILASGAGALGVRLGDPVNEAEGLRYRPELGLGDEADAEHMQSAEGMMWRALVLWLVVLLLLTLSGWIAR